MVCLNLNTSNIFQSKAEELHKTLGSPELTRATLDALMTNFVETAEAGTHSEAGWPSSTYFVSKIGWSALSRIQQREMAADPRADIVVNHVHPGYVDTDMTSHKGPLTIDRYHNITNCSYPLPSGYLHSTVFSTLPLCYRGAQSAVYASLLPPNTEVRGAYLWHDNTVLDWVNGPLPAFA